MGGRDTCSSMGEEVGGGVEIRGKKGWASLLVGVTKWGKVRVCRGWGRRKFWRGECVSWEGGGGERD